MYCDKLFSQFPDVCLFNKMNNLCSRIIFYLMLYLYVDLCYNMHDK